MATDFGYCYPCVDQSAKTAAEGLTHFRGLQTFQYVYTDKSPTLIRAVKNIGKKPIPHETSVPCVPQTNGIAEAMVGRTLRGIRANLAQAGLPRCYWKYAAQHHRTARNIMPSEDGVTPWEKRHGPGQVFTGVVMPFGCLVHYKCSPISQTPDEKMDLNMKHGVFLGYVIHPGHNGTGNTWSLPLRVLSARTCANMPLHLHAT